MISEAYETSLIHSHKIVTLNQIFQPRIYCISAVAKSCLRHMIKKKKIHASEGYSLRAINHPLEQNFSILELLTF